MSSQTHALRPQYPIATMLLAVALASFAEEDWTQIELIDPDRLSRTVDNDLRFERVNEGFAVSGQTDASRQYQLVSVSLPLAANTAAVQLQLKGEILAGGVYVALLDDAGRFLPPVRSFTEGRLPDLPFGILTRRNRAVKVVLGNIGPGKSEWRIDSIVLEQLPSYPHLDMEFKPEYLGALPPAFWKPVDNSLQLTQTDEGIVLAGQTDATTREQLRSQLIPIEKTPALVLAVVEGTVLRGTLYYALLDERDRVLSSVRAAPAGPIAEPELIAGPQGASSVTLVLRNRADGPTDLVITKLRVEALYDRERQLALQRYAAAKRFQGSAWVWAWRTLFPLERQPHQEP